ncbi:hypothetical protein [Streptacidiphilus sp. PAMC 29251]
MSTAIASGWTPPQESAPTTVTGPTVRRRDAESTATSTLLYSSSQNHWATALVREVLSRATADRNVSPVAIRTCMEWVAALPSGIPKPFFAIGDDGSLGLEWSRSGNYLYLTFREEAGEAYFESASGDEWESGLGLALDKLASALRVIAGH